MYLEYRRYAKKMTVLLIIYHTHSKTDKNATQYLQLIQARPANANVHFVVVDVVVVETVIGVEQSG